MPSSVKPKLPSLKTPVTGSFPADAMKSAAVSSAVSTKSPLSAVLREPLGTAGLPSAGLPSAGMASPFGSIAMVKHEETLAKTPITPPIAYLDFLKLASPPLTACSTTTAKTKLNRTSTNTTTTSDDSAEEAADQDNLLDSAPSTATSESSDCSCDCDHVHKSPMGRKNMTINTASSPLPFSKVPMSAPATGPTHFPSLRIPPSPAAGIAESPVQSPFSARSVRSPFDWDAAIKARRFTEANTTASKTSGQTHSHSCSKSSSNTRTSVRHIREVVTRTVTYTPRMDPAPKGKRRKVSVD